MVEGKMKKLGKSGKTATIMKFNELSSFESLKFLHFIWDHYVIFKTIYSFCIDAIDVQILLSTSNCVTKLTIYAHIGERWI